jgi:hypothetical protein
MKERMGIERREAEAPQWIGKRRRGQSLRHCYLLSHALPHCALLSVPLPPTQTTTIVSSLSDLSFRYIELIVYYSTPRCRQNTLNPRVWVHVWLTMAHITAVHDGG